MSWPTGDLIMDCPSRLVIQFHMVMAASVLMAQATDGQLPAPDHGARSGIQQAVLTRGVQPEYAPEALGAGLQGSVVLYLEVGPTGKAEQIHMIQSLGLGLDEKAIEAARQWHFKPGTWDGRPARVEQSAELSFSLSASPSWRIGRTAYRVGRTAADPVGQVSQPELSQYTRPDDQPCPSAGPVIVNLRINKRGEPNHVKLVEEHGEAASNAVMRVIPMWRFQPGLVNGKPTEATVTFEMECSASTSSGTLPKDMDATVVAQKVGEGISAPIILYKVDPEYSEEARRARYQGTVVLSLQVDTSGHATKILVVKPLGLGLDEKAMEAVNQWRFTPALKNGVPVIVSANIQTTFRLR